MKLRIPKAATCVSKSEPLATGKKRRFAPRIDTNCLEPRTLLSGGSWKELAKPAPAELGTMILLSNGGVMAQGGGGLLPSNQWYQLSPNFRGNYAKGSWSDLAPMNTGRVYYASDVLPDGDVFVAGGEYSNVVVNGTAQREINTGEIFDPTTDKWKPITDFPQKAIGDAPSEVLPNGQVLVGYISGPQTYSYNPAPGQNNWTPAGNLQDGDRNAEETWVKLPDGSILSYSITASNDLGVNFAQRYVPSLHQWVPAGVVPVALSTNKAPSQFKFENDEIGPALLLPDGRVFFLGLNNTAIFNPTTSNWMRGPRIPDEMAAYDSPGAMLPNGQVVFAAHPLHAYTPTRLFDFNPTTNRITRLATPTALEKVLKCARTQTNQLRMLLLPSGQMLLSVGTNKPWIFTPHGSPEPSWRPTIRSVTYDGNGTFTLAGTKLNGVSEGAAYGDDAQMATNYPIVKLTFPRNGAVYYAWTFNWSNTGVATGKTKVTTQFTLAPGTPRGDFRLCVIANGIGSKPVRFDVPSGVL